jgi:uncharacterized membrane protein YfhO
MAVVLDEGTHNITLTYHTPYLRLGAIISAGGFAIYFVIQSYEIHKRKIRKANVHLEVEQ